MSNKSQKHDDGRTIPKCKKPYKMMSLKNFNLSRDISKIMTKLVNNYNIVF